MEFDLKCLRTQEYKICSGTGCDSVGLLNYNYVYEWREECYKDTLI
jgi:hypothetical protein